MRMSDQKLNLKFVKEVEKREVLYNFNLPGYSRKDVVEKAWKEISEIVNLPVSECREKWRNVRTVFIRKKKPSPKGSRSRRKAYYLADAMKFCLPFIKVLAPPSFRNLSMEQRHEELSLKPEQTDENECDASMEDIIEFTHDEEQEQEQEQVQQHESILPEYIDSKKTALEAITNIPNEAANFSFKSEQKNALKMFLLSLIPEVENFSDSQIKLFKRRIFHVIDEISGVSYDSKDPLINSTMSSVS